MRQAFAAQQRGEAAEAVVEGGPGWSRARRRWQWQWPLGVDAAGRDKGVVLWGILVCRVMVRGTPDAVF